MKCPDASLKCPDGRDKRPGRDSRAHRERDIVPVPFLSRFAPANVPLPKFVALDKHSRAGAAA